MIQYLPDFKGLSLVVIAGLTTLASASLLAEESHAHHENMHHQHDMNHGDDKTSTSLRDPHAYAGDFEFGKNIDRPEIAKDFYTAALMVNRLEQQFYAGDVSTQYDLKAWYGKDFERLMLKAEGEVNDSRLEESRTELLWSSALTSFWDTQIGLRQDSGDGPNRTWLAAGVSGLAPYWFEVDATAYISDSGRAAFRFEADYELLLTQKWIIQPRVEVTYFTKEDPKRGIGENLSSLKAGLRLRYEVVPEFAPYIGLEWQDLYGQTKSLAMEEGEEVISTSFVAGLKFWF
jgi:copper resistance protein B